MIAEWSVQGKQVAQEPMYTPSSHDQQHSQNSRAQGAYTQGLPLNICPM